jgi:SAM-dependent methyltransferase
MEYSEVTAKERYGSPGEQGAEFDYLCVDAFMQDIFSARALATAFETGVIDYLLKEPRCSPDALGRKLGLPDQGMAVLLGFLDSNKVIRRSGTGMELTEAFRHALDFRDLLQMKLSTAAFGAHDLLDHFTEMVRHPRGSIGSLEFCRLFDYHRGLEDTPDNYRWTKRWMDITGTLTRYESAVCMKYHDFTQYSRMLDIGGNSGEFLLQACRRHPGLTGTVFDLPVVCRVGREQVAGQPEAQRIAFLEGDALNDSLPSGFDLVSFKSMLHDWPDEQARRLLMNGSTALRPGGRLLIFERAALEPPETGLPFSSIPLLLFFGAYRAPGLYETQLADLGFDSIETRRIQLDMPFHLITALRNG